MIPYLPHTEAELQEMLAAVGFAGVEELFADIPEELRLRRPLNLPAGASEFEVVRRLERLADANCTDLVSFLGCGAYDHLIPEVVTHVTGRSEFFTSYTPYQAEISQGLLQAIFEYQTLICQLTGMEVTNASLYDGHTAASEAAVLALASVRHSDTILYSATLHPFTKEVLKTHFASLGVRLQEVEGEEGALSEDSLRKALGSGVAALIVQSPNVFGYLEDYRGLSDLVHRHGALLAISSNPISLGVVKPQGEWGADIAIGDTQPLGLPPSFGGPTVGYIAARQALLRKLPGRIVGQSLDTQGRRAYLLTLQAREQHIRRERATSNICSNQALAALANAVYLCTMGRQGVKEVGRQSMQKAHYLYDRLVGELHLRPLAERPFFNEFALVLERDPAAVVEAMLEEGFLAGVPLGALEARWENLLVVAVTEKRTREELDRYVDSLGRVLS